MFEVSPIISAFLVAALVFFVVEMMTFTFYAFFLSIGCLIVALLLYLEASLMVSVGIGGILTCVLGLVFQKKFQKKNYQARSSSSLDTLIGEKGILSEGIDGPASYGTIIIDGTAWRATAHEAINKGVSVVVASLAPEQDMTVVVEKN